VALETLRKHHTVDRRRIADADRFAKEYNMPVAYNPEADRKSWEDLKSFLDRIFAK